MFQEVLVALVGLFRGGESGELAHGVELAAITASVNTAGIVRLAGIAEVLFVGPIWREIGLRIQAAHGYPGDRGEASVAVFVLVDAAGSTNGLFRCLLQSG